MTDDFLNSLFQLFYDRLGIPQATFKRDYHGVANAIPVEQIASEVYEVLDAIRHVATLAKPTDFKHVPD